MGGGLVVGRAVGTTRRVGVGGTRVWVGSGVAVSSGVGVTEGRGVKVGRGVRVGVEDGLTRATKSPASQASSANTATAVPKRNIRQFRFKF